MIDYKITNWNKIKINYFQCDVRILFEVEYWNSNDFSNYINIDIVLIIFDTTSMPKVGFGTETITWWENIQSTTSRRTTPFRGGRYFANMLRELVWNTGSFHCFQPLLLYLIPDENVEDSSEIIRKIKKLNFHTNQT